MSLRSITEDYCAGYGRDDLLGEPRFDSWRGVRREVIYLRKAGNRHYINIFEDSPLQKKKKKTARNKHTHTHAHTQLAFLPGLVESGEPPLNDEGLVCCDV